VAVTDRLSSNDPNLQNIPVEARRPTRARAWRLPAGSQIASADYSQIELRIMAHGTRSSPYAFTAGLDVQRDGCRGVRRGLMPSAASSAMPRSSTIRSTA
jgi:DNA polymerase-1